MQMRAKRHHPIVNQSLSLCSALLLILATICFVPLKAAHAQELKSDFSVPKRAKLADSAKNEGPGNTNDHANIAKVQRQELSDATTVIDPNALAQEKVLASVETRPFTKAKRGEIAIGIGVMASDIFLIYMPLSLRGAYHFDEHWALEATASFTGCFTTQLGPNQERAAAQKCVRFLSPTYDQLMNKNASIANIRQLVIREYQVARFGLNPIWSPIVGKFAIANSGIVHFDINLSAGLGVVLLEVLDEKRIGERSLHVSFEGNLGIGARFFILDFLGIRLDFRQYFFGKEKKKSLATSSEFSLGLSFLL